MKLWKNIVFLLPKWWYNKITMLIWKLRFMICTLGTLSEAINNRYSLIKSFQLFRHKFKIKLWKITSLEIRLEIIYIYKIYTAFLHKSYLYLSNVCTAHVQTWKIHKYLSSKPRSSQNRRFQWETGGPELSCQNGSLLFKTRELEHVSENL